MSITGNESLDVSAEQVIKIIEQYVDDAKRAERKRCAEIARKEYSDLPEVCEWGDIDGENIAKAIEGH